MYSLYSCDVAWEKKNLLEDEMKVQIRIPIWLSQIPDLAEFLFGQRHIHFMFLANSQVIFI